MTSSRLHLASPSSTDAIVGPSCQAVQLVRSLSAITSPPKRTQDGLVAICGRPPAFLAAGCRGGDHTICSLAADDDSGLLCSLSPPSLPPAQIKTIQ